MSLKIGIVGLPNVGKSTLFKALTKKHVEAQNYAFTTIEPNVGIVEVPDLRLEKLSAVSHSQNTIPALATFVDIAGLVKDAHKGEGLGNQFLANIREVHTIVHVLRAFDDPDVTHVHGSVDPGEDHSVITTELLLADLATVKKRIGAIEGKARSGDKQAKIELEVAEEIQTALEAGTPVRTLSFREDKEPFMKALQLLTAKPELRVYNVDETDAQKNFPDGIAISAKIESELSELPDEDARQMLHDLGWKEAGLNRLIRRAYELLHLITYFTSGEKETRGWSVVKGATAPQAAGEIHTDFEKKFIKAEVINWEDFVALGGEQEAKGKGKMHLEGKEYVVQDGDVMYFHTNA